MIFESYSKTQRIGDYRLKLLATGIGLGKSNYFWIDYAMVTSGLIEVVLSIFFSCYYIILYYIILYYIILYYIILYYIILYYIILYYIILYFIILYYIILLYFIIFSNLDMRGFDIILYFYFALPLNNVVHHMIGDFLQSVFQSHVSRADFCLVMLKDMKLAER